MKTLEKIYTSFMCAARAVGIMAENITVKWSNPLNKIYVVHQHYACSNKACRYKRVIDAYRE